MFVLECVLIHASVGKFHLKESLGSIIFDKCGDFFFFFFFEKKALLFFIKYILIFFRIGPSLPNFSPSITVKSKKIKNPIYPPPWLQPKPNWGEKESSHTPSTPTSITYLFSPSTLKPKIYFDMIFLSPLHMFFNVCNL